MREQADARRLAQRAAALLRGGVPAVQVWRRLTREAEVGAEGSGPHVLHRISERLDAGADTASALADAGGPEWRVLAAAWRVSEESGAPLASTLDRFGRSMRSLARVSERRSVLLAGPRATIRLISSLPPVGLLLSWLLGFDPLRPLGAPLGWAVMLLGAVLFASGVRWAGALTRRLAETDWIAGWEFELVAIGLSGAGSSAAALRLAVDAADLARAEWVHLDGLAPGGEVVRVLEEADSLGSAIVPSLLREAAVARDRAQAALERAAERLGVRVLIPLGVCVLLGGVRALMAVFGAGA